MDEETGLGVNPTMSGPGSVSIACACSQILFPKEQDISVRQQQLLNDPSGLTEKVCRVIVDSGPSSKPVQTTFWI